MAELLVKATDATNPDPAKDRRGCYKRGDIVVVMPDGHPWGRLEGPPTFEVVKVPGVAPADLAYLTEPETDDVVFDVTHRRRRQALDLARVPRRAITPAELDSARTVKPRVQDTGSLAQKGR